MVGEGHLGTLKAQGAVSQVPGGRREANPECGDWFLVGIPASELLGWSQAPYIWDKTPTFLRLFPYP